MMMQHSGYNLSDLVQEAQHRWLKPPEVLFILKNYEDSQLTDKPLQKPPGGSLFLFNKRVLRYFRKDGHSWRRKKDGRTVGEAHERLKVGNAEALNCYYAHGELNPNFQRRSYWMLEPAYEHIVLVHYRDITEVRHSGGSILQSSPGSYSTLNQSPSSYTTQVPGTTSFAPEFQEQIQILSNPGSVNGSFQSDIKNDMINISDVIERNEEIYSSPKVDINQALKRLTQQLSLEDNCSGDNESFYDDNGVSHDTEYNVHGQSSIFPNQLQDDSDHRIAQLFPGDGKGHYWQPFEDDFSCNEENAILNELLGSYNNAAPAGSQETHLHIPNENEAFLSPSSKKPVEEEESFEWADLAVNDTFSCPTSVLLPEEAEYFKIATYSPSMNVYGINSDHYSTVFEQVPTERPLEENPSLTVSQKQLFTIHEISPEWGYAHEATKVIVIGSFLCDPSDHVWTCMFGEIEVPVQIIHDGVIRCQAPPSLPGKVTLCLTSSNRESCSEVREFEYRECPSSLPHSKLLEAEASKDSEELLFLVRFVQMLLSDPLISKREISGSGIELLGNVEGNEELWSGVIESLLAGNCTSSGIANWLLQELLKDKLQQWLSSRLQQVNDLQGGSFSKKEQGIIHMVAGMGYEWALKPILNSGVNVNYRDTNGFTALHWAARFGREEMVAALIASGASAEAVTDPTKEAPTGKTPASIAAEYGYLGLAGYLSEVSLTSHLSSLTIAESELSKNSASLEAERTINSISDISTITSEDQQSFRDSLAAVRNTAEAAARIQAAFRAHSFRKRKLKEAAAAAFMANVDSQDQYSLLSNDAQSLSAASKLFFRNTRDYNNAALSIQKKYRGWKSRRDFLAFRQKVVKIQAHVRGHQVRKYYKVICWAVGILEKVVLRWRRGGVGLRGFRNESESIDGIEDKDEDIVTVFRKQKILSIDEAVARVLSMVTSSEARQQYRRMLDKYRQAKAELGGPANAAAAGEAASTSLDMSNMESDGTY
ncbi:calmodulin-binding transcription activator 4 [Daucus carota subsp. sativus]|uniref:calmodulin-binding transcription activator 4 n=1 Tax=Daucus carota subsp. sativus TaxID=79200 RepID=UPI0007F0129E|nr:PREDICTED: calmodulin-binding transcription activator 4-like [Daucus carota subsp. sativus]